MSRHAKIAGLLASVAIGVSGCGGGAGEGGAVAHVGGAAITSATLAHWIEVMRAEHFEAAAPGETAREHALSFLIGSQWLLGEAAARGMAVSAAQAERQFGEKLKSYPGGAAELSEFLKLSGRTIADAKFVAKVEVAARRLQTSMTEAEPKVTPAAIAAYYQRHKSKYVFDEQRAVVITRSESKAKMLRVRRGLESGKLTPETAEMVSLEYGRGGKARGEKALYKAIYAATPGVLTGPLKDGPVYFLFKLTAIIPEQQQTLAEAQGTAEKDLVTEQHEQALLAFVKAWRATWVPRTSCLPGYVVWECREYRGAAKSPREEPFSIPATV